MLAVASGHCPSRRNCKRKLFRNIFRLGVFFFLIIYVFNVYLDSNWVCVHAKSLQSCPILFDPMDYRHPLHPPPPSHPTSPSPPPCSSVHGIILARILESVAMPSSKGSSPPKDRTRVDYTSCIGRQILYH